MTAAMCHPERSERSERSRRIPCRRMALSARNRVTMRRAGQSAREENRASQAVSPPALRRPDCASDDSARARLCARRQPGAVLGRSLSSETQFGVRAVAGGTVWPRWRTNSTAGDNRKPDSTPGDSWSPIWPPSCRRGVSLCRGLSPGRQSGQWAVAGASEWVPRYRRGVSLASGGGRIRPAATTGGQTQRAATRRGRFRLLAVAGRRVWMPRCRRGVSLAGGGGRNRPAATIGTTPCQHWAERAESKHPVRGEGRDAVADNQRHSAARDPSTPLAFGSLRSG